MRLNSNIKTSTVTFLFAVSSAVRAQEPKPNIIFIFIDDMGYADLSSYGGNFAPTTNIDQIGKDGIVFKQFYVASPISSPSRVGLTTGMYPTRWGITTYLFDPQHNAKNEQNNYLLDKCPTLAHTLQDNGYATGHFGKWHMGGGHDLKNVPSIRNYGFDEYVSTYHSPDPDPLLTASDWIWCDHDSIKIWDRTRYFVDKTLDFLKRNKGKKPCFVNLWPDDVHIPWVPSQAAYNNGEAEWSNLETFIPVLAELDVQIGRLMQGLKDLGIDDNTIVMFTSDNGPYPSFNNERTGGLRGQKGTLWEGGFKEPFMIRWPDQIKPGQVNESTVIGSVDIFPSICSIVDVNPITNGYSLDGIDMSKALVKNENIKRPTPLFWEYGKNISIQEADKKRNTHSPHIAMRKDDFKLVVNADGSEMQLYNIVNDPEERIDLSNTNKHLAEQMKVEAIDWFKRSFRQHAND